MKKSIAEEFKLKRIEKADREIRGFKLEKLRLMCERDPEPHLITCEECGELYCTKCEEHFELCPCLEVDDV